MKPKPETIFNMQECFWPITTIVCGVEPTKGRLKQFYFYINNNKLNLYIIQCEIANISIPIPCNFQSCVT